MVKESEVQKIVIKISKDLNKSIENSIEQYLLLGQATIISSLLYYINNEKFNVEDIKEFFKILMKNNQQLKNMTYDCMKDY